MKGNTLQTRAYRPLQLLSVLSFAIDWGRARRPSLRMHAWVGAARRCVPPFVRTPIHHLGATARGVNMGGYVPY